MVLVGVPATFRCANNFYPGYAIKSGEKVLIMVSREYDPLVLAALQRAIREAGAKVDVFLGNDVHPNSKDGTWSGDGSTEFEFFTYMSQVESAQAGGIDRPATGGAEVPGELRRVDEDRCVP